jgi:hypothetical protein
MIIQLLEYNIQLFGDTVTIHTWATERRYFIEGGGIGDRYIRIRQVSHYQEVPTELCQKMKRGTM